MTTLDEFTIQQLRLYPQATGELSGLLRGIGLAAKMVSNLVNKAAIADILGAEGSVNIQGENVQKLDVLANNTFIHVLRNSIYCAGMVSEENEDIIVFDDAKNNQSKYVVLMDPLDGSANIDVNMPIGTIFSIYRRVSELGKPCTKEDFLQKGDNQFAAGYVLYGSSTIFVYGTKRHSVNGFTLDNSVGEFYLSHPQMKIPAEGKSYAFDYRYYHSVDKPVRDFLDECNASENGSDGRYANKNAGCMVADMHRILLSGGIFLYPARKEKPKGKLRLMYECNPFAFLTELCGGGATDGRQRIMEIVPQYVHERSPVFIGSSDMVDKLFQYINTSETVIKNVY
ncbi:fructose-bisphosphatase [Arachidicoccus ginsenosidimutans]|uniref:class 1 fructose-bisphosphatase n=1 Tax=Arachidicoccus sp. BS20 TaxID=1850526 RepID=UPI0007F15D89|nr:class 1 fructose-bisphosphatase [Arachidicoccus sp. BS20]ANI88578.1 fructose-bisphosphatase [Arachidicoccus sp. BS20]